VVTLAFLSSRCTTFKLRCRDGGLNERANERGIEPDNCWVLTRPAFLFL
jgi:hypothetical protein